MLSVLAETWERLGTHDLRVITMEVAGVDIGPPVERIARAFGDPLRFPGAWIYAFRMWRAARAVITRRSGPVLLVPQDSLATGAAAALAGWMTKTPVVVMDHGSNIVIRTEFFWRERLSRRRFSERIRQPLLRASVTLLYRITCRLVDFAFVPSQEAEDRFTADGVPHSRIRRYHVPLDTARFHPGSLAERREARDAFGVSQTEPIALSLGRLTPEKGVDTIIRALASMPPEARPMLLVGGDGPLRTALAALATDLEVTATFVGPIDPADLPVLFRAADLFTYASRQGTNVPVAILEAMASGLVVVGTDQPPAVAAMLDEGRGFLAAADDPAVYAGALAAAMDMTPDERQAAGAAARNWVTTHHSPTVLDEELRALLAAVNVAGGRSAP